jgi:hypothetical protein
MEQSNMPIDKSKIVWDVPDPSSIKWDEAPAAAAKKPANAMPNIRGEGFDKAMAYTGRDAQGGVLRGAGGLGATLLTPYDMMAGNTKSIGNPERRTAMDDAVKSMGADPESPAFQVAKLGTELAGVGGVGPALAKGVAAIPGAAKAVPNIIEAIRTAGMSSRATGAVGNALTRAIGGGVTGGASAGLIDPEMAPTGAVIGGALPVVAKVAGEAGKFTGKALRSMVAPEVAALAKRAKELGIDIPADRLTDNKALDAVASGLNYVPFSGRAGTEARMNSQLNQAISRTFGQDSSNVTMALRKANDKLGGEFERVLSSNGVKVDAQLMDDLAGVYNKAQSELGPDALKPIASNIDDLMAKAQTGVIDGRAAYNIKRDLDRIGGGNTTTAWHALELKKKIMEALDRSLGPDAAASFKLTRQQYGNMLDLEKLAKNGAEGELSVARIANIKNIGNEPLQEIADIAAQFVKAREGAHGSAQRAATAIVGGIVAGPTALTVGAGAGRGVNTLLNSNALRNAMTGQQAPNKLMELAANPRAQQLIYRTAPVISGR